MKMQTPTTTLKAAPDPADIALAQVEARQRRRHRRLIVVGVATLIVSYPLSLGTVVFLDQKGLLPSVLYPILQTVYFPIIYAVMNVPLVEHIFKCYLWSLGIDL